MYGHKNHSLGIDYYCLLPSSLEGLPSSLLAGACSSPTNSPHPQLSPLTSALTSTSPSSTNNNSQAVDWIFKKERIFLLAQFWQQVIFIIMFNQHDDLLNQVKIASSI